MLNSEFSEKFMPKTLPKNVELKEATYTQFQRGFLMIPNEELLITSFPFRGMDFNYPSIGFHTNDITVLSKFDFICSKISKNSLPYQLPPEQNNVTS